MGWPENVRVVQITVGWNALSLIHRQKHLHDSICLLSTMTKSPWISLCALDKAPTAKTNSAWGSSKILATHFEDLSKIFIRILKDLHEDLWRSFKDPWKIFTRACHQKHLCTELHKEMQFFLSNQKKENNLYCLIGQLHSSLARLLAKKIKKMSYREVDKTTLSTLLELRITSRNKISYCHK